MRATLITLLLLLIAPTAAIALPAECAMKSIAGINESAGGPSFSPDGQHIAFHGLDAQGNLQLWTANADGTGRDCLSCKEGINRPPLGVHKVGPAWSSKGDLIIVQVETSKPNPSVWIRKTGPGLYLAENGVYEEIWAVRPDGSQWWKLRDITDPMKAEDGNMHLQLSPDSTKLAWSRLYHRADSTYPWGGYSLMTADLTIAEDGTPSLQNTTDITPAGTKLIEAGGWTLDNQTVIAGADTYKDGTKDLDIVEIDQDGTVRDLTHDTDWDEHPSYSPDRKRVAYMDVSDLDLMNTDGTGSERLTQFNPWTASKTWRDAGREWPIMATTSDWNPDGTQLAVTLQSIWRYPAQWVSVITFNGPCGQQP